MVKIPTIFQRDEAFRVIPNITPGCEWVMSGNGIITIKIDGMNVRVIAGNLYKRYKPQTGSYEEGSYTPVKFDAPEDKYLVEALRNSKDGNKPLSDGIYEAYGPKINGNPQDADNHYLVKVVPADGRLVIIKDQYLPYLKFGASVNVQDFFDSLKRELESSTIEGFVFHYEDRPMEPTKFAKIKRKDFGLEWPIILKLQKL